jgi:anti-sigma28 factor (negative regulator of flagellin synthesis)
MDIKKISQAQQTYDPIKVRRDKEREEHNKKSDDSVELSSEAVRLFQAEENKKVESVREKIQAGFYSKREVVEKVADDIMQKFSQV